MGNADTIPESTQAPDTSILQIAALSLLFQKMLFMVAAVVASTNHRCYVVRENTYDRY